MLATAPFDGLYGSMALRLYGDLHSTDTREIVRPLLVVSTFAFTGSRSCGDGDPETIRLQVLCEPLQLFPSSTVQVSELQALTKVTPNLSLQTFTADCRLFASSESRNIAQSPPFRKLEVSGTPPTPTIVPPPAPPTIAPPPASIPLESTASPTNRIVTSRQAQASSPLIFSQTLSSITSVAAEPSAGNHNSLMKGNQGEASQGTSTALGVPYSTSTLPTQGNNSEVTHHTPPLGTIIGGIIGVLAVVASLFGLLCYWQRSDRFVPLTRYQSDNDNGGMFLISHPASSLPATKLPDYGPINDTPRQMERFQSEVKNHNTPDNGTMVTEDDIALWHKKDIIEEYRFEASSRKRLEDNQIV
ncbi:hypothetical protein BDZ94DRAFT_1325248 [Collybia nuda]|uniref:Uncharacterized protein n=1 Tax=Collybia nuda TaxID=64659 RepID=A0A9P5Y022_9AGAR|nr:hypothetical protein BDZ94DRAFT_1325248 [Collybia nuda]